jgi:hypothetical protein
VLVRGDGPVQEVLVQEGGYFLDIGDEMFLPIAVAGEGR